MSENEMKSVHRSGSGGSKRFVGFYCLPPRLYAAQQGRNRGGLVAVWFKRISHFILGKTIAN